MWFYLSLQGQILVWHIKRLQLYIAHFFCYCFSETKDLNGLLSLIRISDTLHLIVFESNHSVEPESTSILNEDKDKTNLPQKVRIEVDLDTVDVDETKQTLLFRNENITFTISDEMEMKQLMEVNRMLRIKLVISLMKFSFRPNTNVRNCVILV